MNRGAEAETFPTVRTRVKELFKDSSIVQEVKASSTQHNTADARKQIGGAESVWWKEGLCTERLDALNDGRS